MPPTVNLREINVAQFACAKRYWAAAFCVQMSLFAIAVWTAYRAGPTYTPQLLLLGAIASELLQLRSDVIKGHAEALLRTLDFCRSFAGIVTESDKRDLVLAAPRKLRRQVGDSVATDLYFGSVSPYGPTRAVENLLQSAWYTRQQAYRMTLWYAGLMLILVIAAVVALMVTARVQESLAAREQIVRVVTAWLLLIISLSMTRNVWAYWRLSQKCVSTEQACEHLLAGKVAEGDAMKQWYEYQLARSASPLIPDWVWRVMRTDLEAAWKAKAA